MWQGLSSSGCKYLQAGLHHRDWNHIILNKQEKVIYIYEKREEILGPFKWKFELIKLHVSEHLINLV